MIPYGLILRGASSSCTLIIRNWSSVQRDVSRFDGKHVHLTRMTPELWDRTYGHIHRYADHLIKSAKDNVTNLPPVYFDFIYCSTPNAYAFKAERRYFIGITTGMRFMLEFLFFRMLSDARMFTHIGNAAAEQDSFPPLKNYTSDAEDMYRKQVYTGPPKDAVRRDHAIELLTNAMFFIIGHELAHITRGHVDYLTPKTGTPIISECDEPNTEALRIAWNLPTEENKVERQAIEMDADRRSVMSSISSIKNKFESPESAARLHGRCTLECLLFDWSVAMNTFFRLYGDLRATRFDVENGLYPPPPLRRFMAVKFAQFIVQTAWKAQIAASDSIRVLRNAAVYVEAMFQILTGELSGNGVNDAFRREGDEYSIKLFKYWHETIAAKIQKSAFEFDPSEIMKPGTFPVL